MCALILQKKPKIRGSVRVAIDYTGTLPWADAECKEIENIATNAVATHIAKIAKVIIVRSPLGIAHGM